MAAHRNARLHDEDPLKRSPLAPLVDLQRRVSHRLLHGPLPRTLALLLLVVPITYLLIEAGLYYSRFETRRTEELQNNLRLAQAVATTFDAYLQNVSRQELALGVDLARLSSTDEANRHLLASAREFPSVRDFRWLNPQGRVIASSDSRTIGFDETDRAYYQEITNGQTLAVTDLYLSHVNDQPTFAIYRAMRDERGDLRGIVVATTDLSELGEILGVQRNPSESIAIIDRQGRLVYRYPGAQVPWEQRNWAKNQPLAAAALAGQDVSGTFFLPGDKRKQIGGLTPIRSTGWIVEAFRPEEEAMAPVAQELLREMGLYVLIAGAAFVVALVLARSITKPVRRLQQQALAVGRGELGGVVDAGGPTEIVALAAAFNHMAAEIRLREQQRKLAQGEAEEARKQVARVLDRISDGFFALDNEWRFTYLNGAAVRRAQEAGIAPETLLGQSIWEVLPESVGSTFYNEIQRAVAEQVTVSFETFWRRPGLWVEIHAYPSKDGLSIYQRDITERIRAKEELESERARLEAVLRQMPAGVVIAEAPSGKIILANEQMEHIWRQPFLRVNSIEKYREYLGFHPDGCLYEAAEWPLARSIAGGETVVGEEIAIKRGDGTRGVISVNSAPVTDSEGRTVAAVAVFQDITALKEVERLKGEFVSIASHELRTPVTSLKGYSQTIMRRRSRQLSDPESDLRALRAIEKQSDRLVHLIDELLEVSRLNVGQLELHRESVDLGHLAGQIIDHLSVTTEKHRLRLQCQRPVLVEADSGRVEQVLVNLLTNAIKYSPDGGDIDVAILPRESEVVISVRDRGIGIPRARQVQLFEPFYRAHRGAQQDFGGIGLGLYISRQIIERHGGDMWMHSEEGAGSTFHFTLPLVTRRLNKISPPQEDTLERSPLTS